MKRILYVEDNEDTASAVKSLLSGAGFEVELACNGAEALEKSKGEFDAILLDIMLPDMSGWDIFEKLKGRKSKFAFLSAIPVSDERLGELKRAGISDYITKPFTKNDLIRRVKNVCSG